MVLPFRVIMIILALLTGVATSYSVFAEEIYDVLDGTGPSKEKVDVVEWEGNLEVHVYPKASAGGLGVKLDDRTQGKKVMVIAYRFKKQKEILVRRATLGVPFTSKLQGFIDPSEKDFDKYAISNQNLPAPWKPYRFEAPPKTWYPAGDERNDQDPTLPAQTPVLGENAEPATHNRAPASVEETVPEKSLPSEPTEKMLHKARRDDGSLNQYNW
jgi:hypothetical protein